MPDPNVPPEPDAPVAPGNAPPAYDQATGFAYQSPPTGFVPATAAPPLAPQMLQTTATPGMPPPASSLSTPLQTSTPNWWMLSILLAAMLTMIIAVWLVTITPHFIPAPAIYQTYTAHDKAFRCDAPDGWTATYYSDPTPPIGGVEAGGMMFSKSNAVIDVHSDSTDKLDLEGNVKMLGQAFITNRPPSLVDAATAIENSRLDQLPQLSNKSIDAVVTQANISEVSTGSGSDFPALSWNDPEVREFTGLRRSYPFLQKVHGYCIAMVGSAHFVILMCYCPDQNWYTLKPAFQHVALSMLEGEQDITYSSDGTNSFTSSAVDFKAPQQAENDQINPQPTAPLATDYSKPNWDTGTPLSKPSGLAPTVQPQFGTNQTLPGQGNSMGSIPSSMPGSSSEQPQSNASLPQQPPAGLSPSGAAPQSQGQYATPSQPTTGVPARPGNQ